LENHDEPRAAATFPGGIHEAAAVLTFLSPGLRFFHQGQFEGRQKRISPHLVRAPNEPVEPTRREFYEQLLGILRDDLLRNGRWQLLECTAAWADNWTHDGFIAFAWDNDRGQRQLVVVNFSPYQSQCYLRVPWRDLDSSRWRLVDSLSADQFDRDGDDLQSRGLYLDMYPWQTAVYELTS
jgi:hypothetical protein